MRRELSTTGTVNILRPLAVIVLFIYPVLKIVQGIDFTDMGFNLSNQWLLLHDPGAYQHGYLFYLSNLLGGLWLSVAAPFGLFWMKFGWALMLYLTMGLAYLTLKDVASRKGVVLGLAVALLWITRTGVNWIDYNWSTALLFTAAAFLLHRALVIDHRRLLLAGAAILGASVFARFPNVLSLGFGLVIPLAAYADGRGWAWMLRRSLVFLAGFVAGIFVILALMLALGHLEPYVAGLERRFSTSSGYSPYQYVTGSLLSQIASDYDRMARVTALAASALAVLTVVLRRHWRWRLTAALILGLATFWTYNRYAVMFPWWILAITAAVAFAYTRKGHESAGVSRAADSRVFLIVLALLAISLGYVYSMLEGVWLVPGLLIVFLVHRIVYAETTPHRLAAGLALAALVITPLGSSNGLINAMFGMWLAIPLAFAVLVRRVEESADPAGAGAPALFLILVVASALAGAATRISYYSTYRDTMDRTRMTASIDHPLLRGVLTTPERASVVQELLPALGSRVHAGEPLLLHGGCALVHLLTDTRPVLGSTWNGVYDPPRFHELLVRFGRSDADLPLVLLSKGSCRDREWPLSRGVKPGEVAKRKLLRKFMHARDYALVWQNEYFEIWEAPSGVGSAPPDGSPGRSTREDARAAR